MHILAKSAISWVLLFICAVGNVTSQDVVLEGIALSDWGVWGEMELCPPGSFVYGMRLKVHQDQGAFEDDTALNGIELLCISGAASKQRNNTASLTRQDFGTVSSSVGHKGDFGLFVECPDPWFVNGFQFRSERPDLIGPLGDDTAGNNIRLICNDVDFTVLEGYGTGWGDWTAELKCPRGLRICGIQTRVEGPNGDDDTTLNDLNMGCCTVG